MSAIEFLMSSNGTLRSGGNLSKEEQKICNDFARKYGNKVRQLGKSNSVPASQLSLFKIQYLLIAKDKVNYHFVFIDKSGDDTILYQDLTQYGVIPAKSLIDKLRIEVGEVDWMVSIPVDSIKEILDDRIEELAKQYIEAILQAMHKPVDTKVSDEAISVPELGKYIEAFKRDYPKGQKTAFIIMQFSKTKAHDEVVQSIKDTLKKHDIIGLRADDKEYADDLFQNIRTYMHCADFGISVFERILKDDFNPNVSLEVGYMMGMGKSVCLLKDQTLANLYTDLVGKLYKPFDPQNISDTLPGQLEKWMKDKGII